MPYRRKPRYPSRRPRTRYGRYGTYKTKYSRKRGAYKLKVKRGQTAVNFRSMGLPKTVIAKLKFNHTQLFTIAGNTPQFATIIMNDPRDPLGVLGTDQPAYFSQLCTSSLYNRFTCYKATYKIRFWNQSNAPDQAQYLVWYGDNADIAPIIARATTNALLFEEREQSTAYGYTLSQEGSTQGTKSHKGVVTTSNVFGTKKSKIYDDDNFSGASGASPLEKSALLIAVAGDPTTTGGGFAKFEISVVYHVKFWDLANNLDTTT